MTKPLTEIQKLGRGIGREAKHLGPAAKEVFEASKGTLGKLGGRLAPIARVVGVALPYVDVAILAFTLADLFKRKREV